MRLPIVRLIAAASGFALLIDEDYRRLWQRIQAHRRDYADEQPQKNHP